MRDFTNERLEADADSINAGDWGAVLLTDGMSKLDAQALAAHLAARWNACADALEKLDEIAAGGEVLAARIILREAILGKEI